MEILVFVVVALAAGFLWLAKRGGAERQVRKAMLAPPKWSYQPPEVAARFQETRGVAHERPLAESMVAPSVLDPMAAEKQAVVMAGPIIASRLPYLARKADACTDVDGFRDDEGWDSFVERFIRDEIAPTQDGLHPDRPAWLHVWSAINTAVDGFRQQKMTEAIAAAAPIIATHIGVLSRKFDQLSFRDEYGDWEFANWERARNDFVRRKIATRVSFLNEGGEAWFKVCAAVEDAVARHQDDTAIDIADTDDPLEYERLVATTLLAMGWDARTTIATGDQGADVIAEKHGRRLVIQCKLLSQPVGNKAVQEAFAAKRHQRADFAAVVSNAGYTKSARQLASTTGVHLLHHGELLSLDVTFGTEQSED